MEAGPERQETSLPPLPFNYERTYDPKEAAYVEWRKSPISIVGEKEKLKTDEEIIDNIKLKKESTEWYLFEYWRKKGVPKEQLEFQIGERNITVFNYNEQTPLTSEHAQRMQGVFQELASKFPKIINELRWIMVDNNELTSGFGDPERYPFNGDIEERTWHSFKLMPRGMGLFPHRITATTNFEGTLVHELSHLTDKEFVNEWGQKFQWQMCQLFPDDWELRDTPDGTKKKFFNKHTGEMSPQGFFPLQPEQCVTLYARQNMDEDICEGIVAYIYDPELLKSVSPDKFAILQRHDAKREEPEVSFRRIPKDQISLPEIKPDTIYYYIQEPISPNP